MATYCVTMYVDIKADSLEAAYEVANSLVGSIAALEEAEYVDYSDVTEVDDV